MRLGKLFPFPFVVLPESAGVVALPRKVIIHAHRKDGAAAVVVVWHHFRCLQLLPVTKTIKENDMVIANKELQPEYRKVTIRNARNYSMN
jgi:hypothetical protein